MWSVVTLPISPRKFLNAEIQKYFSVMFIESVLTERFNVVNNRDSGVGPGLEHPVHQLPLSGDWIILQDLIVVGVRVTTA